MPAIDLGAEEAVKALNVQAQVGCSQEISVLILQFSQCCIACETQIQTCFLEDEKDSYICGPCLQKCPQKDMILLNACTKGDEKTATFALENGANPNFDSRTLAFRNKFRGCTPTTPLLAATRHANIKIIKLLLDHEACINQPQLLDKTALIIAAEFGHAEIVKELLKRNANLSLTDSVHGMTAYLFSVYSGNVSCVKAFIDHGVNIDETAANGYNALIIALRYQPHIAPYLLDHNAKVNQTTYPFSPLRQAVEIENTDVVRKLIQKNADVNQLSEGWTILAVAARKGNMDIVRALANCKDIDIHAVDYAGYNALHRAIN